MRRRGARGRAARRWSAAEALTELVRSRLTICGPITSGRDGAADRRRDRRGRRRDARARIGRRGAARPLHVGRDRGDTEWCDRALLARIHRYTLSRLRAEIEPVSPADFMRFLFKWQHVDEIARLTGPRG
jgi:ATP-dependent Lhr-like helicase